MIEPERLADQLQDCAVLLRTQGGATWMRCEDWETARMPRPIEPDDDEMEQRARAGITEEDETRRRDDAAASRYKAELATLTRRIEADTRRLCTIMAVCNPARPKQLANRDLLLAQVAAEGFCVSCWRVEETCTEVAKGRYRDLCRQCGEFKSAEGRIPPLPVISKALTFGWSKITTDDVSRAMAS